MNNDKAVAHAGMLGFDAGRLRRIGNAIERDVAAEKYDGATLCIARGGDIAFFESFGYADRASGRALKNEDVFMSFSIAKQFTHTLALAAVERGDFALTTRVADIIPEFACRGKENVTLFHLLTHTSGLTLKLPPMMDPMQLGNLDAVVAAACGSLAEFVPGERVYYSGLIATAVMADMIRRVDAGKRAYRDILAQDLFGPLGMHDTALGARPDLAARLCPVVARDRRPGISFAEEYEMMGMLVGPESEIPALGCLTTAGDLHRFANMLLDNGKSNERPSGRADHQRILSPAMIALAMKNHTGAMPNGLLDYTMASRGWSRFPACLGLGFYLRGEGIHPHPFGALASAATYGGLGAGSTMFWIDPQRDVTCAYVSAGLITDESRNIERLQRISDLVLSSLVS